MLMYVAYNEDGKPYDYFDSYEAMHHHLASDSSFKSYKSVELDDSEAETLNKYILARNRLAYLAGKKGE